MRFYVCELKPEHATGETEFYDEDESRTGDAPKCELCGRHIGALTWLPPYRVELELWDSVFGDIAFGPGDNLLVSERFKTLWDERGLTGLQGFDPVEVVKAKRHKGNQPDLSEQPNYYCVSVARSQAAIDVAESGLEREDSELCPACRSGLQGGGKVKVSCSWSMLPFVGVSVTYNFLILGCTTNALQSFYSRLD